MIVSAIVSGASPPENSIGSVEREPRSLVASRQMSGSFDRSSDPDRQERGKNADKENGAPSKRRLNEIVDCRGQRVADRPRALHERERLAAMLGRPCFGDERRAARPFASHSQSETDAKQDELSERRRKPAGRREHRIQHDARHQRARSTESIGNPAEPHAAGSGGQKRDGSERAARLLSTSRDPCEAPAARARRA